MAEPKNILLAETYAAALNTITGARPTVRHTPDYSVIELVPDESRKMSAWIDRQLSAKPGAIRFNLAPAFVPPLAKKALPILALVFAAGLLLGKKL